jgi:hypothetical protein
MTNRLEGLDETLAAKHFVRQFLEHWVRQRALGDVVLEPILIEELRESARVEDPQGDDARIDGRHRVAEILYETLAGWLEEVNRDPWGPALIHLTNAPDPTNRNAGERAWRVLNITGGT